MRSLLRWTAALVTGALLGETALAGDWPVVRQVSFSADSRRVLVLTGHVQDGSGFPEATLPPMPPKGSPPGILAPGAEPKRS